VASEPSTYDGVNYAAVSVASEPSTVKMSNKTASIGASSSHNSCYAKQSPGGASSDAGSRSDLLTFSRDSLGSPKSFYSSYTGASDYCSRDDDAASSGVADKPPDVPEINEVRFNRVSPP